MAALAEKLNDITVEEYLAGEEVSEIKHEYVEGQVYAMAGAKVNHNRIATNVSAHLWNHLRGKPCEPLSGDMLVKTLGKRFRYPDVVVVCEDDPSEDERVRESPILIVEVLSKSTRKKDKGEKRLEYLSIPSLQEYVLIEQDFAEVEVQRRREGWQPSYYFLGDEVVLESVNATLPVEAIYERVRNDDVLSLAHQLDVQQRYTYQDYLRWPDEVHYELLEGEPVMMSAPSTLHQRVIRELVRQIGNFLLGKSCEIFPAPFDVCLAAADAADDQINNVVQPDISVICDANKIHDKGCKGAPDWIIEVLSPSTASKDLIHKLRLYERYGVREYWVVHPIDRVVMMWQLAADSGRYGAVLIEETQGTQVSGLFPDLVLEWDVLFPPPKPPVYVKEPPPGVYYSR